MKGRILLLTVCATFAVVPAMAQVVYSNGPINGNTDAWTINFGFVVSDSFSLHNNYYYNTTITGASFGMWLFPDDTLTPAELSITSLENGGTSYFDQTVNFTQSGCVVNNYGYDVCQESTAFSGPTLNNGTYWTNLQNASVPSGDPVYWDENSGGTHAEPPGASESEVGTIPSESFTVLGNYTTTITTSTCGAGAGCEQSQSVSEPSSLTLLGSGCMALFGVLGTLRRKLF